MNNQGAFFALVRAGLWEQDVRLLPFGEVDFPEIYRLAEEQAVTGLVAAGIGHVTDTKVPQVEALTLIGSALQQEQRNLAMNRFIAELVEKLQRAGINTLLVKGQGIAQCYERPLWRSSGDIDFYLSKNNFEKAKEFFRPLVGSFEPDNEYTWHICMHYDDWAVEIHANQHSSLSPRIDRVLDEVHHDLFHNGNVRNWKVDGTTVFLPSPDNDVLIVFTHFLKHFYKGGLGLRQVCDWCRLLWTYREEVNRSLLERRLCKMRLMTEWKAFAAFAVEYLGMPVEAMPLYDPSSRWRQKGEWICSFIMEVGNMGHNRDSGYYDRFPYLFRKAVSFGRRCKDSFRHAAVFPLDSVRFFLYITYNGLKSAFRGE